MYISTAMLTGIIALSMFFITPPRMFVGQVVVFLVAILVIVGTLPVRKGLAIALDFWLSHRLR